ncbi:hypothetical protein PENSPDRAFT_656921 [Peniophora sp. CONT]|nr:hypothetical protein PENSPDRAFT_656921 [Peniophora sp. CONT]
MAENVPYLGAISKALTTFKEVLEEVDVCKKDCRAAATEAIEFVGLMLGFEANIVPPASGKESELRKACRDLGSALLNCLGTLQTLGVDSKRKRDRFMLFLKRGDVQSSVSECRDKMRIAKEKFNMIVASDTNRVAHEIRQHLLPQSTGPPTQAIWRLRAASGIFHGREWEVEAAVELIVNEAPARVAILGPGGIGKTSIALAVLHEPQVKDLYGDQRCFVSCEAITTADGVVRALADALDIGIESGVSSETSLHRLISHLRAVSGIICLDNLETPLDADKHNVEELLNEVAALSSIALLITSRDTSIPTIKWTFPPLAHIEPFTQEAALATWDVICQDHDKYALKLVDAVDCMPLAVTLLARLTSVEGSAESIWNRWVTERTDLIRTGNVRHRLFDVSASIELSLRSLGDREEVIAILSFICLFSDGFPNYCIKMIDKALPSRLPPAHAITLLKQLSLIYTESHSWDPNHYDIRVLSPILHHIQQHYFSDEFFLKLADTTMQDHDYWIRALFRLGLNRPGPCRERCIDMVIANPALTKDVEVLAQAIGRTQVLEIPIQPRLHECMGHELSNRDEYDKARSSYLTAIEFNELLGDREAVYDNWTWWLSTFIREFDGSEDECQQLDEVQDAIHKAWNLGCYGDGVWQQSYVNSYMGITVAQHFVNEGRRKLHMPVVHRSGIYEDNDSTVYLSLSDQRDAYHQLVLESPPPWDLSLILETIEGLPRSSKSEDSNSSQESVSSAGSVDTSS